MVGKTTKTNRKTMGYEDDYRSIYSDYKLYVDGFDSIDAIRNYLSGLINCTLLVE